MIAAIVQARMGSSRFAGRVLEEIEGHSVLWHVLDRLRRSRRIHQIVVATTGNPEDDAVVRACECEGIAYYRGSELDVLDRFYETAKTLGCDVIARFRGDCPMLDPRVIDRVLERYLRGDCDYTANDLELTFPEGLEVEAFSFAALETAWARGRQTAEREQVTLYLRAGHRFRRANVAYQGNRKIERMSWRVQTPEDLVFARRIFAEFKKDPFGLSEVLSVLDKKPELEVPLRLGVIG